MRLFAALPLAPSARAHLLALHAGLPGARWVPEDNLHLTLSFFGEVDGATADDLADGLSQLDAPAFLYDFDGVGLFGGGEKARVLWARAKPDPALLRLRDKVETIRQRAGLPPEGRKYTPHVTLAYLKGAPAAKLERYVAEHSGFALPDVAADRVTLYSSWLTGQGSLYREELSVPLAGGAPSDWFDDDDDQDAAAWTGREEFDA